MKIEITNSQAVAGAGLIPGLADRGLLMMAGHVVPLDAVSVEIVEDGEAGLGNTNIEI